MTMVEDKLETVTLTVPGALVMANTASPTVGLLRVRLLRFPPTAPL